MLRWGSSRRAEPYTTVCRNTTSLDDGADDRLLDPKRQFDDLLLALLVQKWRRGLVSLAGCNDDL
jgi:hypothetical protein